VGLFKGFIEAIKGEDLVTGEGLNEWARVLGIVPFVGRLAARGEFAIEMSKMMSIQNKIFELLGLLLQMQIPEAHQGPILQSFLSGPELETFHAERLSSDLHLYRYYGPEEAAGGSDGWFSDQWIPFDQRSDVFSHPPGSSPMYVEEWVIPAGATIVRGTAAPSVEWGRSGGGNVIFVPERSGAAPVASNLLQYINEVQRVRTEVGERLAQRRAGSLGPGTIPELEFIEQELAEVSDQLFLGRGPDPLDFELESEHLAAERWPPNDPLSLQLRRLEQLYYQWFSG
jgi:hypothetical protein